ncbi:hypothetical protein DER45DRAFT_554342 [Fusarium avenaceum]|nr:hypothetical protein DER45DRAFT_554342 [Fusarium avenaceum]
MLRGIICCWACLATLFGSRSSRLVLVPSRQRRKRKRSCLGRRVSVQNRFVCCSSGTRLVIRGKFKLCLVGE